MIIAKRIALIIGLAAAIGCHGGGGGGGGDAGVPFTPDSPATYVAKVKQLLVGLQPTDAEVAAVTADPTAINGLVTGWMALPQYTTKMQQFFELAFQQTQITSADTTAVFFPNGIGQGAAINSLMQNVRDSFALTVLGMVAANQPLTNAFTTKTVMMTPALMFLYAMLDEHNSDDKANVVDAFQNQYPKQLVTVEASAGPIPFTDSVNPLSANFMHFYDPSLPTATYMNSACNGQDPITFAAKSFELNQLYSGTIPNHKFNGNNCGSHPGTMQYLPSDFTDWKPVTIRTPNSGESTTTFFDLPALRNSNELVLLSPHPGFFSTPAFFMNWPTNASNQMRVTLNQALIVATGTAIDGTDATSPNNPPGIDPTHTQIGSPCYGCHQLLDPTRSILSATYSDFYSPQTDQALINQPGLFAFQGVIQQMSTIDDFAKILAGHPLVPQAWAEKLCYYANSAPCDPTDPVFTQIVSDFSNGFNWNTLVAELMSSSIITNATQTKTWITNGEVIAVSRRDHLCAALNTRLDFNDICELQSTPKGRTKAEQTIAEVVSGVPSDGYGRGAPVPVLPVNPSLFYRAGLENICGSVAALTIDAKPNVNQPNAKQWSSSQSDAAIADFVAIIMGIPPSDPRSAGALSLLQAHYTAAQGMGASKTDALVSTFTAACLSPSFIGIGM